MPPFTKVLRKVANRLSAATIIMRPKKPSPLPPPGSKPRTEKDWDEEEKLERIAKSARGPMGGAPTNPEQAVANDNYAWLNWSNPKWSKEPIKDPAPMVSFYFPAVPCILDYVDTKDEKSDREKLFKKLKIPYVGLLPDDDLAIKTVQDKLIAQGAKIERAA